VTTLVHAFVSLRVDHCNAVLAGAPKVTTDKLQCALNVATRVVSGTHKFNRGLLRLLHTELHWLNVLERVAFKLGLMVFNCLHNQAPQYLVDLCCIQCCLQTTPLLCHVALLCRSSRRASLSSQQLRSAVFLCGRPCDMELITKQFERPSHQQRLLQTFTEDVFIFSLLVCIAH